MAEAAVRLQSPEPNTRGDGPQRVEPSPRAVEVDPHHGQQLVFHGYTVLLTGADGTIGADTRQGLFDHDTRVLSRYELLLDNVAPRIDSSGLLGASRWIARFTVPRSGGDARGPRLPQDCFELTLSRRVACGVLETIDIDNHSATAAVTTLVLRVGGDFADIAEVGGHHQVLGDVSPEWDEAGQTLAMIFHASRAGRSVHRGVRVRVLRADSSVHGKAGELRFDLRLPPRGRWRAELAYEILVDDRWTGPVDSASVLALRDRIAGQWLRERTRIESDPPAFGQAIERAAEDLLALRNWEYDEAPDAWIPNAGLPTYTGLFGRDVLTAAWQSALLGPEIMRGAIARLALTQSTVDSAWHDAEPGKMIHEMRRGPLSELDVIPQRGYYGTETSSSIFVVTLSELWHWTGDTEVLRKYLDAALRACEWADRYGDRDNDGFLEYATRSPRGLKNQSWKDSDEAIRYPDGALVDNPIATVEEQAYHCLALLRMAEVLLAIGDDQRSADFLERARRLKKKWHEAFWIERDGFYAMALDGAKQPVCSVGSNPGHALATGLVPVECARRTANRLMATDLFSGWGIRTLSSHHPSYNPLAYHLGTVWPVESATIALGFKRYGFEDHVERLATAMFDAADRFRYLRLPEALGGHSREDAPVPTVYPMSNSPQAWSASAAVQMAQAVLGIYPFAPARVLALVNPVLPPWLKSVTVRRLRVGDAHVSLRFNRTEDGSTRHDVLDKSGAIHVLSVPPPQRSDRDQHWGEAVAMWILRHAPGRTAAALRIALGVGA